MQHLTTALRQTAAAALIACSAFAAAPSFASAPSKSAIAWQVASTDAEVDRAFALARQSGKPVFLYWGAVWCPPCNQVKATLFTRPDFVERTRAFVPVYVDGDKPGAQKIAARFKVSGYPTMVLFKPDGTEVTRLPGEVDPERYLLTLSAGMGAQVPVKELVRKALSHQQLTPEQWRLLAYYSWDTDQQQLAKNSELASMLSKIAAAVPADQPRVRDRLAFKAVVARARDEKNGDKSLVESDRAVVDRLLADKDSPKELSDLFIYYGDTVVKYLASTPDARSQLASKWDSTVSALFAGGAMSRTERIDALDGRIDLWKLIDKTEKLGAARQQAVVQEVNKLVAETTDRYERQSVIPSAAHVLTSAGLVAQSDALLKAELPRAVAPYYHMLVLAGNAKERGDKAGALQWYEQAWRKSEGPATKIQWGGTYVKEIISLTPEDANRISSAAGAVIGGLEPKGETFFERNERSLQRMARQLATWQGSDASRAKVVSGLKGQLNKTCLKLPAKDPGRANCESVFSGTNPES